MCCEQFQNFATMNLKSQILRLVIGRFNFQHHMYLRALSKHTIYKYITQRTGILDAAVVLELRDGRLRRKNRQELEEQVKLWAIQNLLDEVGSRTSNLLSRISTSSCRSARADSKIYVKVRQ